MIEDRAKYESLSVYTAADCLPKWRSSRLGFCIGLGVNSASCHSCGGKGLKSDQGRRVCRCVWDTSSGMGMYMYTMECQVHTSLGGEMKPVVMRVWQGDRRMGLVFCRFVGSLIQQIVVKSSLVISLVLGAEGESDMKKTLLRELPD